MGSLAFVLLLALIRFLVLLIPAFVAFHRQYPNRWAIAVVCLAFGGTVIGWFGAMVWAMQAVHKSPSGSDGGESGLNIFVNDPVQVRVEAEVGGSASTGLADLTARLARLKQLADAGTITPDEHAVLRRSVLDAI